MQAYLCGVRTAQCQIEFGSIVCMASVRRLNFLPIAIGRVHVLKFIAGVRAVWGPPVMGPPGPHNASDMGTGGGQISSVIGTGGPRISGDMGIL